MRIQANVIQRLPELLRDLHVPYVTEHRNLTERCVVGLCCPECGDTNFHLGIFADTGAYYCFRCQASGSLRNLLVDKLGLSLAEVNRFLHSGFHGKVGAEEAVRNILETSERRPSRPVKPFKWPRGLVPIEKVVRRNTTLAHLTRNFLKQRGFTVEQCVDYDVYVGTYDSSFRNRLILPVFFEEECVGFQARDMTGLSRIRYLSSKNFPKRELLYNYDDFGRGDSIVIVEGIFKAWRVTELTGMVALATFGTQLSKQQILLISRKNPSRVFFCWDGDAKDKAKKAAAQLASIVKKVHLVELPDGTDPDDLGRDRPKELLKWLRKAVKL